MACMVRVDKETVNRTVTFVRIEVIEETIGTGVVTRVVEQKGLEPSFRFTLGAKCRIGKTVLALVLAFLAFPQSNVLEVRLWALGVTVSVMQETA